MLTAARHILRRVGFVGALLLALMTTTLAVEAQACAPDQGVAMAAALTAASDIVQVDPCAADDCRDCGLTCTHGCCHAPHVAVVEIAAKPPTPQGFRSPTSWPDVLGAPHGAPSGLERPPRA